MPGRKPSSSGFKTSIIALFVAIVLVIGLTLVYMSFARITAVTDAAASQFIDKVAELSADRIGSQLKLVRDNLDDTERAAAGSVRARSRIIRG